MGPWRDMRGEEGAGEAGRRLTAGDVDGAGAVVRRMLAADPRDPWALLYDGLVAHRRGDHGRAATRIGEALAVLPDFAVAHYNLGVVQAAGGDRVAAIESYRRAVALAPTHGDAHYNLAMLLAESGDAEAAKAHLLLAVSADPGHAEALNNLGGLLLAEGRADSALERFDQALRVRRSYPEALLNAALALHELGGSAESRQILDALLDAMPDYASAHWNRALLRLADGDLARGWVEYEWRWRMPETPPRPFAQPPWAGDALNGRAVLLHAEQGFGDTFQFCRYARLLADSGARVVLEVQPPLKAVLTGQGLGEVLARGEPLPPFDVHLPLMSLPLAFGTTVDTIPAKVPYIVPDPSLAETWRTRLGAGRGLRVGLAWAGRPTHAQDWKRSLPAAVLAPLVGQPGVEAFSLQVGPRAAELADLPAAAVDLSPHLADFADTAAALAGLDLIVAVDTAVTHLAGAMGRETWVMLPWQADWRWLRDRDDSPWYPSARLFRQPAPGDWATLVATVAEALGKRAATRTIG